MRIKQNIYFLLIIPLFLFIGINNTIYAEEDNFIVTSPTMAWSSYGPKLLKEIDALAEKLYKEEAQKMLGGWKDETGAFKEGLCIPSWSEITRGKQPQFPISVEAFSPEDEMLKNAGGVTFVEPVGGNIKGWMKLNSGIGSVESAEIYSQVKEFLENTLGHEMNHVVLGAFFGGLSKGTGDQSGGIRNWAAEGLACNFERRFNKDNIVRRNSNYEATIMGSYFSFRTLLPRGYYPTTMADMMQLYRQAPTIVDLLTGHTCEGYRTFVLDYLWRNNGAYCYDDACEKSLAKTYFDDKKNPFWPSFENFQKTWYDWVVQRSPQLSRFIPGKPWSEQLKTVVGVCNNAPAIPVDQLPTPLTQMWAVVFCNTELQCLTMRNSLEKLMSQIPVKDRRKVYFKDVYFTNLWHKDFQYNIKSSGLWTSNAYPETDYFVVTRTGEKIISSIKTGYQTEAEMIVDIKKLIAKYGEEVKRR